MKRILKPKIHKQSGIVSAEYAAMMGLVCLGFVFGISFFGADITSAFLEIRDTIGQEVNIFSGEFQVFICTYSDAIGTTPPANCPNS